MGSRRDSTEAGTNEPRRPELGAPETGANEPAPAEAGTNEPAANVGRVQGEASAADLFALLWAGLADMLGTAAAATLLRRAAQGALPRAPELVLLRITRQGLEYRYTLPSSWSSPVSDSSGALSALARELWPLLVALTGSVVIHRLAQVPELRVLGIEPHEEPKA